MNTLSLSLCPSPPIRFSTIKNMPVTPNGTAHVLYSLDLSDPAIPHSLDLSDPAIPHSLDLSDPAVLHSLDLSDPARAPSHPSRNRTWTDDGSLTLKSTNDDGRGKWGGAGVQGWKTCT